MADERPDRRTFWLLGALLLLGFGLRVAGAQGGLWLDEAWSAVLAEGVGTPLGILLSINHDNNHHLNSLWLQLVGLDAPPLLARGLSIASGTAAIWVAWRIGARRSAALGLVMALLFAISPILVTLGSEARGYAPMVLAFLVAVRLTDRWRAGATERRPAAALALCFLLGALSQLTIIIGFCALAGWLSLALWRRGSFARAARESALLLGPSAIVLAAIVAMVIGAAAASGSGWQFGDYQPFDWAKFVRALADLVAFTLGLPTAIGRSSVAALLLALTLPVLALLAPAAGVVRANLHRLLLIAFPLLILVLQFGNSGYPRYYLILGVALLLLAAEFVWRGLGAGGAWRAVAGAALATFTIGSLLHDAQLIRNQRGDPGAAVRALAAHTPDGASVMLDRPTGRAVLQVAAAQRGYRLHIVENQPCSQVPFLFLDRFDTEQLPAAAMRCGRRYEPIAQGRARGFSGSDWALYSRRP